MDRESKAGGRKTRNEFERSSLGPVHRPPVVGWLCCRVREELRQVPSSRITQFDSGFIPLAIFRDRLTALMYAYSLSTPEKFEYSYFSIFIEDGTNGYEDPPARAAAPTAGMTLDERAYVKRLEAKICEADIHYEGADRKYGNDYEDDPDLILVFPLKVMNPPMDTISPHVKLTCAICPASKGIVLSKCEGCDNRQHSRYMPSEYSRLVCESEVEYFPSGIPYLFDPKKFADKLATCLAKNYPDVTCLKEIPTDLARHISSFLPIELFVGFLKLPVERRAATEAEFKQQIILLLPKRIATSVRRPTYQPWVVDQGYDYTVDFDDVNSLEDLWELNAKYWRLKYSVNDIPEDANWSSLGIVVIDDSEDSALRKCVSFLRNRIPSKYLSEGSKCVVDLLMISKNEIFENNKRRVRGYRHATVYLKLEFYEANGSKHCDWYFFKADLHNYRLSDSDCSEFLQNSTIVYLKDPASNSDGESDELGPADVEMNNLAHYLLTAYDHSSGTNRDSNRDDDSIISSAPLSIAELHFRNLPTPHCQNIALLLNEALMDVSNWKLCQLWTKLATLFQIPNFKFINHQDQTTPVNTPANLVVLTDDNPNTDRTRDGAYLTGIQNSALATAYRNNSNCLKALQSFDVNVVVLNIGRYGRSYGSGEVREVYRYQLSMSRDHRCGIFSSCENRVCRTAFSGSNEKPSANYSSLVRQASLLALFDALASLRHRPVQVECWDLGQGSDYLPFRNPFGFVPEHYLCDGVVFTYEHDQEDRPDNNEDPNDYDDPNEYANYDVPYDSDTSFFAQLALL